MLARAIVFISLTTGLVAIAVACGSASSASSSDAGASVVASGDGATADAAFAGDPSAADGSAPRDAALVDAAMSVCPSIYSVYGDRDASDNLGNVDPTLFASGTCGGPTEQFFGLDAGVDAGFASTDLKITLQQSAPRSGMFVTVIHQTTPFAFDLTTCLESAGQGTGSARGIDPGTLALVNDPEMERFPQVQLGTNFMGTDLIFDVSPTLQSSFALNKMTCTFTKN